MNDILLFKVNIIIDTKQFFSFVLNDSFKPIYLI